MVTVYGYIFFTKDFMSNFPKKWCQNIYNKMRDMNMTRLLSQEIEKRHSNFSITFDSISTKLTEDSYESTKEWINEVNSILLNELRFYDKNTQFYTIIIYLQKWFEKKVKIIPSTAMDAWMIDYQKVQKRMKKLSRLNPPG